MMRPAPEVAVHLCVAPVDMRKQATSLALLVEQSLGRNVFEPALYVFTNRKRDRVRIVYWERNGLCLWSKRVEQQQFIWPRAVSVSPSSRQTKAFRYLSGGRRASLKSSHCFKSIPTIPMKDAKPKSQPP